MKKSIIILFAAAAALVSCQGLKEEFQPVFTFGDPGYEEFVPVDMDAEVNATIAQIKALYTTHGKPVEITDDLIIKGQITTSDEDGNVYREIYIQDATGGLDVKLGRSSSYDDFKPGQILYIKCKGLTIGEYGYKSGTYYGAGLLQLGLKGDGWQDYEDKVTTTVPEYETAYIDLLPIINKHIFRGRIIPEGDPERIQPATYTGAELTAIKDNTQSAIVGNLCFLPGLTYGNKAGGKEVFCLFYPDPNLNHTKNEAWNRVFLSSPMNNTSTDDYTFGITTWALTKNRFYQLASAGLWDDVEIGDSSLGKVGTAITKESNFGYVKPYKEVILEHPSAQSVSQYFVYDGVEVQIRTSGYSRFADIEIPATVRSGRQKVDVLGVLSRYQGGVQFTLLDVYKAGTKESLIK
ncbi:MAG: hypothetical protein IK008_07725 [Bacteroidales bacterium]|nr:hypothetical protein [Bacteroidales bacterium]